MVPLLEVVDGSTGAERMVGTARFSLRRGMVSTTFSYADSYLEDAAPYAIDPALPLRSGPQHCEGLLGAFRDSAPDRWGRHLVERDHRAAAAADNRAPRQLDEVDYLIGVFDMTREGSLRFREPGGPYLAERAAIPPLVELPRLLHASREVALGEAGRAEVKALLNAGSGSLGGARPKASVCDGDRLLLAKFSHPSDEWNVMAWEKTALDMAAAAGIAVPAAQLVRIGDEWVLLLERFDRAGSLARGVRIPFMSGMTALGSADGDARDYAELAEVVAELASEPATQLQDLFARVTFSVAIANTDDHLRNWGFLRQQKGWEMAPLFDVNPNPEEGAFRVTSIAGERGDREERGLRDLAAYAGLSEDAAREVVGRVLASTMLWKDVARKNGCPEREIKLFAPMFARKARQLREAFGL